MDRLDVSTPQHLLAEHPSELIPSALYLESDRDWDVHPVIAVQSSTRSPVDIVRVQHAERAVTSGRGYYAVFFIDDLVLSREEVFLLWVQMEVRVYEPLMPRVSCITCSPTGSRPPPASDGGGSFVLFTVWRAGGVCHGQEKRGGDARK